MILLDASDLTLEDGYRVGPDGRMYGCMRCQNGDHWACHGCDCPCSDQRPAGDGRIYTEHQEAVIRAIEWRKGTDMYVDLQRPA